MLAVVTGTNSCPLFCKKFKVSQRNSIFWYILLKRLSAVNLGHKQEYMRCSPMYSPYGIHSLLKRCIGDFMKTLQDPDINVQRVVLVTYNSAGHNRPSLIRDLLDTVLPHLYNETKVREAFRDWMSCRRQRREIFYYSWSPESLGDEKRREGWQMFEGRQEKRSGGSGRVKDVVDELKAYWSTNQGKLNNTDEYKHRTKGKSITLSQMMT